MPDSISTPATLKEAVAVQFAKRPTLRQVLSQRVFDVVAKHYPDHAAAIIEHDRREPYTLLRHDSQGALHPEPFLDLLLKAFVQGLDVAFGIRDTLLLVPYDPAQARQQPASSALLLAVLNRDLDAMLGSLMAGLQQAQVAFWNADDALESGISRHGWMRQMLRLGLLSQIDHVVPGEDERAVLYGVLLGHRGAPSISAIELTYQSDGETFTRLLPDLLIEAEREERQLLVRCPPSGFLQVFDSQQDFTVYLHERFASRQQVDKLTWQRRSLAGDVFLQQSGMLMEVVLADVDRLRLSAIDGSDTLERTLWALTDPARYFLDDPLPPRARTPEVPRWLAAASSRDRFEYQRATLDLALNQALSQGRTSLDGVESLQAYAARRLREQLLADWPDEANYFPDDLLLQVSVPAPAVDLELPVQLEPAASLTLTAFAIGRLSGLQDAVLSGISHRTGQLIMPWLTPTYLVKLVEAVDIGGRYPDHVAAQLDTPGLQGERIRCFAREWRQGLLFAALQAKVEGRLDLAGWQAVAEFCRSGRDLKANVDIAPLGFRADPDSAQRDEVTAMYAITLQQPRRVLLYRPLYADQSLLCYADNATLLAAISTPGELQDSVLDWLPDNAFSRYANGGFLEPHLRRVIFDTSLWPARVKPARLSLRAYSADIDSRLYVDRRRALIELGRRQAVSNATQRWQVIKRFGWLLFDLVAPVLPGVLGKITWIASLIAPLLGPAQRRPQAAADTVLAVDLAVNLAMALLHGRLPQAPGLDAPIMVDASTMAAPRPRRPFDLPPAQVVIHQALEVEPLREREGYAALGNGWGAGPEAQQRLLSPYRAQIDLSGAVRGNGLEQLGGRFYVSLPSGVFEVVHDQIGRRILGPNGEPGPLLVDDNGWRVRVDGFALGGSPGRARARRQGNQARFDSLAVATNQIVRDINDGLDASTMLLAEERQSHTRLLALLGASDKARVNANGLAQAPLERLLALYDEKIAGARAQYQQAMLRYVERLEAIVDLDCQVVEQVDELIDLQRRRNVANRYDSATFQTMRRLASETIVRNCWAIWPRLAEVMDYPRIRRLGMALDGRVMSQMPTEYRAYRDHLEQVVRWQPRLVKANALLDRFIVQIDPNTVIVNDGGTGQVQTVTQVKGLRNVTTVDVRFQQAVYTSDLALRYDLKDPAHKLARFQRILMNPQLMAAAYAHGEVQIGNLSLEDQIDVLQGAWDEYSAALINCIDIEREGGALVDPGYLQTYRQTLLDLKEDAGIRLAHAQRMLDGDSQPGESAYVPSTSARSVVRAPDGQIMVGDEVTRDGKTLLEVRDPVSQELLQRFERRGQVWVDVDASAQGAPGAVAETGDELLATVLEALGHDTSIQNQARQYVEGQVNHRMLERLIDNHVARLRVLAKAMQHDTGFTANLLRQRLDAWPGLRHALLIELYSHTRFPDAQALRYLHDAGLIKVEYQPPRQVLGNGTGMDEYLIRLRDAPGGASGKPIWAAHFHFSRQDDPAQAFTRGHLKAWTQRKYGARDAQVLAERGERIHRGPLTLAQAQGIIPFR